MNILKKCLDWAKRQGQSTVAVLRKLHRDVSEEVYKIVTQRLAQAIVVLFLIFAALTIGPDALRQGRDWLDPGKQLQPRQIRGWVSDEQTAAPLDSVRVSIVGRLVPIVYTDERGLFLLRFQAHPDSATVELSFSKEGYIDRSKAHPIPLDAALGDTLQYFTMQAEPSN